jgi:hypothetical protein
MAPEPPRAPSPEFIPFNEVEKVRIYGLNAPPSYSLVRELDNRRDTPLPRPRSPGALPIPKHTYSRRNLREERKRDMKRWLIEIVALNLEADFDALNAALGPDDSDAWGQMKRNARNGAKTNARNGTVLSSGNQGLLQYSAKKICKVHQLIQQDRVPDSMDAWTVFITFIEPSRKIDPACEDFVMNLLEWYSEYSAFPSQRGETFSRPWEHGEGTPDSSAGLRIDSMAIDYMWNFRKLIEVISLNADVKAILENAFRTYFLGGRPGTIEGRAHYSPVRPRYIGLSRVIQQYSGFRE